MPTINQVARPTAQKKAEVDFGYAKASSRRQGYKRNTSTFADALRANHRVYGVSSDHPAHTKRTYRLGQRCILLPTATKRRRAVKRKEETLRVLRTLLARPTDKAVLRATTLPPQKRHTVWYAFFVVGRGGFEPPKSKTSDLQSDPFGRSGICP